MWEGTACAPVFQPLMTNNGARMTRRLKLGVTASLALAFVACSGGGAEAKGETGSSGGQDAVGTMETASQAAPSRGGQGAEQPPADAAPSVEPKADGAAVAINIGPQAVTDTPVDQLPAHPGHEPLTSQTPSSAAPAPQATFTKEW